MNRIVLFFILLLQTSSIVGQSSCAEILSFAKQKILEDSLDQALRIIGLVETCDRLDTLAGSRDTLRTIIFEKLKAKEDEARQNEKKAIAEKERADLSTRKAVTTDLVFKAKIAAEKGNLGAAFRLASFAYRLIDSTNEKIHEVLSNTYHDYIYADRNNNYLPIVRVHDIGAGEIEVQRISGLIPDEKYALIEYRNEEGDFRSSYAGLWNLGSSTLAKTLNIGVEYGEMGGESPAIEPKSLISLDEKYFISDGQLKDVDSNQIIYTFLKPQRGSLIQALSKDQHYLLISDGSEVANCWEIESKSKRNFKLNLPEDEGISSLSFHPNGQQMLFGTSNGQLYVQDRSKTVPDTCLKEHESAIIAISVSTSGHYFLTRDISGKIIVWELNGVSAQVINEDREGDVEHAVFQEDKARILLSKADGKITIWDFKNRSKYKINSSLKGGILCTSTQQLLASNGQDLLSIAIPKQSPSLPYSDFCAFSSDGQLGVMLNNLENAEDKAVLKIVDLLNDTTIRTIRISDKIIEQTIKFSSSDKLLLAETKDSLLMIHLENGSHQVLSRFEQYEDLAFPKDRKRFVTIETNINDNTYVKSRDITTGDVVDSIQYFVDEGWLISGGKARLSPAGKYLIYQGVSQVDAPAEIYDIEKKEVITSLATGYSYLTAFSFSSSEQSVLIGGLMGQVQYWDLSSQRLLQEFQVFKNEQVEAVALSRDGRWIAACGAQKQIKLFDTKSGNLLRTFTTKSPPNSLHFSGDGRFLSLGEDRFLLRAKDILSEVNGMIGELSSSEIEKYDLSSVLDYIYSFWDQTKFKLQPKELRSIGNHYVKKAKNRARGKYFHQFFLRAEKCFDAIKTDSKQQGFAQDKVTMYLYWARGLKVLKKLEEAQQKYNQAFEIYKTLYPGKDFVPFDTLEQWSKPYNFMTL